MKILIIYNVLSGRALTEDLRPFVKNALVAHEPQILDYDPSKKSLEFILDKALDLESYDSLLFMGGDGTLRSGAQYLWDRDLLETYKIYYVPNGTANLSCRILGISESPTEVLEGLDLLKPLDIDFGVVNEERVFLLGASLGGLTVFAEHTESSPIKKYLGRLSYFWVLLTRWTTFRDSRLKIWLDGKKISRVGHSILVAPSNSVKALTLFQDYKKGFLNIAIMSHKNIGEFSVDMFKQIFFREAKASHFYRIKKIKVVVPARFSLQVDGDVFPVEKEVYFTSPQTVSIHGVV